MPFLCLVLLLGCAGCQSKLTGTVTFKGEHLEGGSVLFVGSDQRPITTRIKEDGTYEFEDVPRGEARLAVYASRRNIRLALALEQAFGKGIQIVGGKRGPVLPAIYQDLDQSGLNTTISFGPNTYDIEMEPPETER
jgi:hypothetical protein